jgi:hypothetical protein
MSRCCRADAIAKAKAASKRVFVCAGRFDEKLAIDGTTDGAQIFGGLKCNAWSYSGDRVVVAPSTKGYALTATGLSSGLRLEDFELSVRGGVDLAAGESSIAAFVASSLNVVFGRVLFHARDGAPGSPGTSPADFSTSVCRSRRPGIDFANPW